VPTGKYRFIPDGYDSWEYLDKGARAMSEQYKEGDTVTITTTGKVAQKTISGYIVTIHGVDVPFVQINPPAQELAQKILELTKPLSGLQITLSGKRDDIVKFWQSINRIEQLCQEEANKQ
jgi:hypothetical protein